MVYAVQLNDCDPYSVFLVRLCDCVAFIHSFNSMFFSLFFDSLWDLCNAEHSHISSACVPLLLHCITLPLGSDVFWRIVQEAFHDADWRIRFAAVERVTVITRFMDSTPLRSEVGLQTALATAFCYLITSMDDISVYVAQRATLYLGTIHDYAVNSLLFCLESQFDLFIVDRPVVLQSLYQLHNSLSDRRVLSWDFFLNRFDTLFVEAQINLEKTGDIPYLRDLRNSETGSDALLSKISKAREALSQSDTSCSMAKTLSASFGTKWPYKRTMSAPASIIPPRQDSKIGKFWSHVSRQCATFRNANFHFVSLSCRKSLQSTNFGADTQAEEFTLWIGSVFIWFKNKYTKNAANLASAIGQHWPRHHTIPSHSIRTFANVELGIRGKMSFRFWSTVVCLTFVSYIYFSRFPGQWMHSTSAAVRRWRRNRNGHIRLMCTIDRDHSIHAILVTRTWFDCINGMARFVFILNNSHQYQM